MKWGQRFRVRRAKRLLGLPHWVPLPAFKDGRTETLMVFLPVNRSLLSEGENPHAIATALSRLAARITYDETVKRVQLN